MRKILTFYIQDSLCGIDIEFAREICRKVEYTPIPGGDDLVAGLLNLRGQVVTLLNLAPLLKTVQSESGRGRHCIILKSTAYEADQIGFLTDKLGEVIEVHETMCQLPPSYTNDVEQAVLETMVKLDSEILLVLAVQHFFDLRQ